MLKGQGYMVFSASDGQEALELSRKYPGPIDLVITDWKLPRLNGSDLCSHLLKERPGTKVMLMTGGYLGNSNFPLLFKPFEYKHTDNKSSGRLGVSQAIILVAEDEVMIRNLVMLLMKAEGYVVLSASDGREGLELSRWYPGKIDLIITDEEMLRLDGMNLIAHLHKERPRINV